MPKLEKSHFDNTHFEEKMALSTARKIAEGVVMTPIFIVACAGAATAGLAIQGVTAAAKLVKEKALGIEDSSDSDSISSSTENMPGDSDTSSQNSSSQSADRSCLDSDDDLFHDYSERVQIDVQIPSHSYSNDNSSYQFHIHINGKLGTS